MSITIRERIHHGQYIKVTDTVIESFNIDEMRKVFDASSYNSNTENRYIEDVINALIEGRPGSHGWAWYEIVMSDPEPMPEPTNPARPSDRLVGMVYNDPGEEFRALNRSEFYRSTRKTDDPDAVTVHRWEGGYFVTAFTLTGREVAGIVNLITHEQNRGK